MKLEIAVRYGKNKSSQVSAERLVNMYAEQAYGISQTVLHGVPGLSTFSTLPTGPIRGLKRHNGVLYAVGGTQFYSVNRGGTYTDLGYISGADPVSMSTSGTQLVVVGDDETFVYGTTLAQVTDPDFLKASSVDYLDGYSLFSAKNSGEFFISAITDATDFDALDFATAESNPDDLVRVFTDHREALLFGGETLEVWTNTGAADFPFERRDGALAEKGCAARDTVQRIDNTVFWLDHQGIVRRLDEGYVPLRISTHEVEQAIAPYISSCTACTYTFEGHEFYALTCAAGTFVYDAATQLWHERESFGLDFWRGKFTERCYGETFVGDYSTGVIYKSDSSVYQEGSNPVIAMAQFPPVAMEGRRFRVHRFELEAERGTSVLGSPTQVRLDVSEDGSNWHSLGYTDLGGSGDRMATQVWRQLGQYERFYPRILISDPAPRGVYGAYVEIEVDA